MSRRSVVAVALITAGCLLWIAPVQADADASVANACNGTGTAACESPAAAPSTAAAPATTTDLDAAWLLLAALGVIAVKLARGRSDDAG